MERVGDVHGMAQTQMGLGNVYAQKGKWDRAMEFYGQSVENMERLGDLHLVAQTYSNLATVYADKREWDRATELYQKSLETLERVGDQHGMGVIYNNLGVVRSEQRQRDAAIGSFARAYVLLASLGDTPDARMAGGNLVDLLGSPKGAEEYLRQFVTQHGEDPRGWPAVEGLSTDAPEARNG
jgi:tetratricopeptide (TPR) repeat protein